jgi:hypothetical protein
MPIYGHEPKCLPPDLLGERPSGKRLDAKRDDLRILTGINSAIFIGTPGEPSA